MHLGRVGGLKTADGTHADNVRGARATRGTKIPLKEEEEKEKEKEKEEKNRTLL